jgi:hypothetical protein
MEMKMKKILISMTLLTLVLSACSSQNGAYPNPTYPDPGYQNPTYENPSDINQYLPQPSDLNLKREDAYVDSSQLLIMESMPLQFSINLKGNLPNPCYRLRISPAQPDAENKINVEVYSLVDPELICVQTTKPYDVNFPLGSYPTGHYFLLVNGVQIAEFDA